MYCVSLSKALHQRRSVVKGPGVITSQQQFKHQTMAKMIVVISPPDYTETLSCHDIYEFAAGGG